MNIEEIREYCLSKNGVSESFPFDAETLVFKVSGKLFLLCGIERQPLQFNVKCDPENAIALRSQYSCVTPGYHMSKVHWNSVLVDGSVPKKIILSWIDDSYQLIVKSLPKKEREALLKK